MTSTALMTMYEIMTLCKHRMVRIGRVGFSYHPIHVDLMKSLLDAIQSKAFYNRETVTVVNISSVEGHWTHTVSQLIGFCPVPVCYQRTETELALIFDWPLDLLV